MGTRIFEVEYVCREVVNGESSDFTITEKESVVADDAQDAIVKVAKKVDAFCYVDKDGDPEAKITRIEFDPINVTLEAEAD